ncbi:transposase [Leptospira santarosai]|uniref:transposase n=1 Tax=Leptospira santarosai TaxID=28183 RepID=UPI0024AF4085|nr:transposase [Leptospira santarosai]MDI7217526.1 transposase [Leptospira santarosai]
MGCGIEIELLRNRKNETKLYADFAYRSCDEFMKELKMKSLVDKICLKGYRNKPLRRKDRKLNTQITRIRGRIEHVFGDIKTFSEKIIKNYWVETNQISNRLGCQDFCVNGFFQS